jgi:hypothetical protein
MADNKEDGTISFEDLQSEFSFDAQAPAETPPTEEFSLEAPEEETPPQEMEEQVEEKTPEPTKTISEYSNVAKAFLDSGEWDDVMIETEEGEVALSSLDSLDKETFLQIVESQKEFKAEAQKAKETEGLDDNKKALLNIIKNGGDLKEIFKEPSKLVKPFSQELGWDLDNEIHQEEIVFRQYLNQGIDEKRARDLVQLDKRDLQLDIKSQQIVEYHQTTYENNIKKAEADFLESKKKEEAETKEFRKNLTASYKEIKDLSDSQIQKYVDIATKKNKEGDFEIDNLYNTWLEDPKKASELAMFLSDPETYLKVKTRATKVNTQLDTMRKISLIPKTSPKKVKTDEPEDVVDFRFDSPPN